MPVQPDGSRRSATNATGRLALCRDVVNGLLRQMTPRCVVLLDDLRDHGPSSQDDFAIPIHDSPDGPATQSVLLNGSANGFGVERTD